MADESKTEKATPRRQKKAREQGQVARSRELPGALAIGVAIATMMWVAPSAMAHWRALYRNILDVAATENFESNGPILFWTSLEVFRWIFPILLAAMTISVLAGLGQGGASFAPQALAPKFDRFNPASKLGQIFSTVSLSQLLKSLLPFAAILWVGIGIMRAQWVSIVRASNMSMGSFASMVTGMALEITWKSCVILLAWSGVDYLLTWWKMQNDMKMTKQEVREEYKETEGNPAIKGRIRQIQRQMRKKQSLKAAATATVIVTNPTHFAVALRYETDMEAPIVVVKGRDLIAEKIKQIGRENGIMLIENKPLAQALYKSVEVGDAIPSRLYQAVAELLAVVFRAQADLRRSEAERRSKNASGQRIGTTPAMSGTGAPQR